MWSYIWPLLLIVAANVVYHISAKATPGSASPFLSLTITYLVGAVVSFAGYLIFSPGKGLGQELSHLNWTSYVMGLAVVGLEAGFIFLYRAGWKISVGALAVNAILAALLIIVGVLFYRENLGIKQIIGIALCIGGMVLING
jgi:multidrug transporter EmrE-like cation transporter